MNILSMPTLKTFHMTSEINAEDFFSLFNSNLFPNLRQGEFAIIIPGDADQVFVDQTLVPFFTSFSNLEELCLHLTFLNEEEGVKHRQYFLNKLNFPFLQKFEAEKQ